LYLHCYVLVLVGLLHLILISRYVRELCSLFALALGLKNAYIAQVCFISGGGNGLGNDDLTPAGLVSSDSYVVPNTEHERENTYCELAIKALLQIENQESIDRLIMELAKSLLPCQDEKREKTEGVVVIIQEQTLLLWPADADSITAGNNDREVCGLLNSDPAVHCLLIYAKRCHHNASTHRGQSTS